MVTLYPPMLESLSGEIMVTCIHMLAAFSNDLYHIMCLIKVIFDSNSNEGWRGKCISIVKKMPEKIIWLDHNLLLLESRGHLRLGRPDSRFR